MSDAKSRRPRSRARSSTSRDGAGARDRSSGTKPTAKSRVARRGERPKGSRVGFRAWRWLALLGVPVVPFAALLLWAHSGARPTEPDLVLRFEVDAYEDRRALAERLQRAGLVQHPQLFSWYLALNGEVEPGAHVLRPGLSAADLIGRLTRSRRRERVKLTLPEGLNLYQVAGRMQAAQVSCEQDFIDAARKKNLLDELGIQAGSVEGYLFPATYDFQVDSTPEEVIRRLVREARKRLRAVGSSSWIERRGWGELEILTLASMIEKEAQVPEERPLISSVFHNRLDSAEFEKRRFLQSDPTSAYACFAEPARVPACGGWTGKVTPALNRDPANRYSTYVTQGLPPGPIASPGEAALRAAVAPAETDYLFFVARGAGRHHFSRSYDEHKRAIDKP